MHMAALSPGRGSILMMRVYPPGLAPILWTMLLNSTFTVSLNVIFFVLNVLKSYNNNNELLKS